MKIRIRCVLISLVIVSVCFGFYFLATLNSHSAATHQHSKEKFTNPVEIHDNEVNEEMEEEMEQNGEDVNSRDNSWKVSDRQYAGQQQAIVRKSSLRKKVLKEKARSDFSRTNFRQNDLAWNEENDKNNNEAEEESIELGESRQQPAAVNSRGSVSDVERRRVSEEDVHEEPNPLHQGDERDTLAEKPVVARTVDRTRPVQKTRLGVEEDYEYVSIDDVRDTESKDDLIGDKDDSETGRRRAKVASNIRVESIEKQDKLVDDLEEVAIDPSELESRSVKVAVPAKTVQSVHQTSHLRSHNIAPVPRVPAVNVLSREFVHSSVDNSSNVFTAKRPQITLDDFNVGQLPTESLKSVDDGQAESYFLIHGGRASKMNRAIYVAPPLEDIPTDHYIFKSNSLPTEPRLRPSIGNGFLSTVIHGAELFMSGMYNGQGDQSHRAAIPSTCSFRISRSNPELAVNRTYQLNVGSGIFSEVITGETFTITQQFYAHRSLPNLIVVEVDLVRSNTNDLQSLIVDLNQWTASYDLTFVKQQTSKEEVSYKVGTVKATESENQKAKEVHIMYDHIPSELVPPQSAKHAKWIFLTSIGTSKEETELYYESGVERIHSQDLLYLSHVRGWANMWLQGRVDVEGDARIARATYASWYYMLSSIPLKYHPNFVGLSPSGLPLGDFGKDYQGRIMHDQELWMFPPLLLFHHNMASHIITSRKKGLPGARRDAQAAARKGALFPAQSAALGRELSSGNESGIYRPQVGAGIVWSVLQSVYASGNSSWITQSTLADMIADICHCLLGSVHHGLKLPNDAYGIYNVTPLDSSLGLVDNSPYINGIVKIALSALSYIYGMENKTTVSFNHFADGINIAVEKGIHPAYDGYKQGVLFTQPDAVLLGYPLMFPMNPGVRRNDLSHYEQVTARESSSLNAAMHAIGWLELGDSDKAAISFQNQFEFMKNDFLVWRNSTTALTANLAYNYLPAAGAYLQSIVNGYGGIRLHSDRLTVNASLPTDVTRLHFAGIDYRGSSLDIVVSKAEIMVIVTSSSKKNAPPLRLFVFDPAETYTLNPGIEVRFSRRPAVISVAEVLDAV